MTGRLWSARSSVELVAGVEELQRLKAKTAALEAELLAEIDVREVAKRELAWGSTADWFTHLAGTTRRQGKRTVVHARLLVADRTATLDALREGTVSPDQADVIVAAVERLPLADQLRRDGEQTLLTEAGRLNATDLHRAGRHLATVVDPDRDERDAEKALDREERSAHLGRFLTVSDDGCGGVRVKGHGSVEDAATLRAALLPLTKPVPDIDPDTCEESPDPRDHGARMWDALVQLAQHALDTDHPPASHGARPRVTVTIDAHTLHGDGSGVGVTDDGLDLPGSAVRRHGLRRRPDPRPPRRRRLRPRRRPHPPPGHPRHLDRARGPRPPLRLPRLHQTPVMCHAHHIATGSTAARPHSTTSSWCAATTTAPSTTPPGRSASQTTANPSSSHHPNPADHHPTGSDTAHARNERHRLTGRLRRRYIV